MCRRCNIPAGTGEAGGSGFGTVALFGVEDVEAAEHYQRGAEYNPGVGDVAGQQITEQRYPQQVGVFELTINN